MSHNLAAVLLLPRGTRYGQESSRVPSRFRELSLQWEADTSQRTSIRLFARTAGWSGCSSEIWEDTAAEDDLSYFRRQRRGIAEAAVDTTTKAYAIQAKYMTINNQRTIVIAYLRREYRKRKDRGKA